jgi:hypothetical protein
MLSLFHRYSFGNLLLIARQKPTATMVAGFNRWRQLGRYVRKGEKAIAILAPLVGRRRSESEPTRFSKAPSSPEADDRKVLFGFRVVYVFDVSQTEGDELPKFARVEGDPGQKLDLLMELVVQNGIELSIEPALPGGALGASSGGKIQLAGNLTPAQMFSTLAHELAHEQLHWGSRPESNCKLTRETEAEAVAYIVSRAMGLECSTHSSDYIQLYSGDVKVLLSSLEAIRCVATRMIEDLARLGSMQQLASQVT